MSEHLGSNGDDDPDSICRDFLRNVCKRGVRCKYRHPERSEAEELGRQQDLEFCHDYQNRECRRSNCRFIHCTREEEEYYKKAGELPSYLQEFIPENRFLGKLESGFSRGEVPICKDNLKGECHRGFRCKFRHVTLAETNMESRPRDGRRGFNEAFDHFDHYNDHFDSYDTYEREPKRRRSDVELFGFDSLHRPQRSSREYLLEEENAMLRRRIEELKKQVSGLRATNEVLLDQNARIRLNNLTKSSASVPVSQTLVQHTITPNAATIAQISQLPLTGDLTAAAQQSLESQRIAQELVSQQSMTAIVPVSLAQAIAPVSIAQAIPAVSLAQSLAMSGSSTLAGNTTTLVSYPVTPSMRAAMSQSSLAH